MGKKYELSEETIEVNGRILHRLKAVRDFSNVKAGDLGGYVESEKNLSHFGNAWVYDDAWVLDNALVSGDAKVYDNALVSGDAWVSGIAMVLDNAWVSDNAKVLDNAWVYDNAKVLGNACVYDNAKVYDNACVSDNAKVYDNAWVSGDAKVLGNALVETRKDYIVFKNFWSSGRYFTWTRSNNKWQVGCFYGTGKELVEKAYEDSEESGREYERVVKYVESILADEKKEELEKVKNERV